MLIMLMAFTLSSQPPSHIHCNKFFIDIIIISVILVTIRATIISQDG